MFSPVVNDGGPAKGTRGNRRRQRPLSSDSLVQQPKAKRQRLPLTETTFVNPDAPPEMFEVKSEKIDLLGLKRDGIENFSVPRRELSVRSKKPKPGERLGKGDGSIVLTSNSAYVVSKLPALPDRVRADWTSRQHGAIYSSTGYGLSLTHTHALVWPYTATTPSPETFVFTLPYPARLPSDPLPLGSLVSPPAASEEPGLVVVMPLSGKITYWESISAAATLDFLQKQRTGVEDSVHGMFSGEFITQIINAESAGFILAFSSGRLAYMGVRDGHGRPAISVQFLRGTLGGAGGGLFGSIRHALSQASFRGDTAAVKSSPTGKVGERTIVAATSKGKFQAWRIQRGGHHDSLLEVDTRPAVSSVAEIFPQCSPDSFELVDFAFVPRDLDDKHIEMSAFSDAIKSRDDAAVHLLLLVSFSTKRGHHYALVEANLSIDGITTGLIRPLTAYTSSLSNAAIERPKLYLPRPALIAFLVFDRAVVVYSLASTPLLPEYQLQTESQIGVPAFEDVIDFRDQESLEIVGSGMEEPQAVSRGGDEPRPQRHKTKNPAAILLVRGVGVVRVSVNEVERFGSDEPPRVTAKSKLEQAVFFGIKDDNPLLFDGRRELTFSAKEIGQAAIDLSHEISSSTTPYILNLPASMESNLRTRLDYLDRLMSHLNTIKAPLDLRTRQVLMENAEKMVAARWIWRQHEQFLLERAKDDKKSVVSDIVCYIHEQQKVEPNPAVGEVDRVRHWFINDIWRLDIFIAWAYEVVKYNFKHRISDDTGLNRLLYESVLISQGSLQETIDYRNKHKAFYGLPASDDEIVKNDPRVTPWTSTLFITNSMKRLIEFCYQWLDLYYPPVAEKIGSMDPRLIESIRDSLPLLTSFYLRILRTSSVWGLASADVNLVQQAEVDRKQYYVDWYDKVIKLKDYKLFDEAIEIARRIRSFTAMAELMVDEIKGLRDDTSNRALTLNKIAELQALAEVKEQQMGEYFEQYKEDFAFPAYTVLLHTGGIQAVLDFPCDKKGYATKFLRTKPELAKISWINDVEREKNINHAAKTLLNLGHAREQQVWSKKIELSLGKLALMVEAEEKPDRGSGASKSDDQAQIDKVDKAYRIWEADLALEVIKIQDLLYSQILPSITLAVDEAAELVLAMEAHATKIPKKQKTLYQSFEDSMSRLLKHEALFPNALIDLLTLAYLRREHVDLVGDQFFLALRVAEATLKGPELVKMRRLIWRRCYIRDDWKAVNDTISKDDRDQLETIGQTCAYSAMWSVAEYHKRDEKFYPIVKPSDALGVYTTELDGRFDNMEESYRNRLLDAMKAEDAVLKGYIEKAQLDKWYRTTLDAAEVAVTASLDQATAEAAAGATNGKRSENRNGSLRGGEIEQGKEPVLF